MAIRNLTSGSNSHPNIASGATPRGRATPTRLTPDALRDANSTARVAAEKLLGTQKTKPKALGGIAPQATLAAAFDKLSTVGGGPAVSRLLSDNAHAWNARWEQLETAKTSIDSTYFILEKDPFGYAYLGFLLKKQFEGVKVRLMTDAMADTFGKHGFKLPLKGKDYLQELVNHGSEAFIYHPIWQRPIDFFKKDYSPLASNHDKIQVIDGKLSVTGGRNIARDYFADPRDQPSAWRDIDLSMEGAGPAKALTTSFERELKGFHARKVSPDRLGNWVKRDIELLGAYAMMDLWLKDPAFTDAQKTEMRSNPEKKQEVIADLVTRTLERVKADLPTKLQREPKNREIEFLKKNATELVDQLEIRGSRHKFDAHKLDAHSGDVKILDQTSVVAGRVNDFNAGLTALIDAAQHRVVIENPYVVLTEEMVAALERAAQRGVDIVIATNSPLSTDSDVTQAFFLEDWAYILARVPTARIFVATGDRKFHGKSAVIDDEVSLVTTYNLDLLSGYVNSEVGAVVKSTAFAKDLTESFRADKADPKNGFLEYTIERDAEGKPKLVDGKPVPKFGPEDHLPPEVLEEYKSKRKLWGHTLRDNLSVFEPLRHPPLEK